MSNRFDIKRQTRTVDTDIGGWKITFTAITTEFMDLQPMRGDDTVKAGGLGIDASYHGFSIKDTCIKTQDIITDDSGTTEYQITFIEDLWVDHTEFFAKKVHKGS